MLIKVPAYAHVSMIRKVLGFLHRKVTIEYEGCSNFAGVVDLFQVHEALPISLMQRLLELVLLAPLQPRPTHPPFALPEPGFLCHIYDLQIIINLDASPK